MDDRRVHPPVAVLSRSWGQDHSEPAFVLRGVAGALSRFARVQVLVPGDPVSAHPDGAFEVHSVGGSPSNWPQGAEVAWPPGFSPSLAIVHNHDDGARAILEHALTGCPVAAVTASLESDRQGSRGESNFQVLAVGGGSEDVSSSIGLHVPVHPLARSRPHIGIGFTDYVLVLTDRQSGPSDHGSLTPLVAWLAARFADRYILLVEDGVASVLRWRSLRGRVAVHTRTDFWRLLAHARMTVDLAPGCLLARECVESLRYGVPIVVPAHTPAARLAAQGGGLWYGSLAELLLCVEALDDDHLRDTLGNQGQALADEWYGNPQRFANRVRAATSTLLEQP